MAERYWGVSSTALPDRVESYSEGMPVPTATYGRETHPWMQATAETVNSAIVRSCYGETQTLQDLYDDVLERDERVSSCVRTRAMALVGRPWSINPPRGYETEAGAKQNAERCTFAINALEEWNQVVASLAEGISRGYAVAEIMWGWSARGWRVPKQILWRHPRRVSFDDCMRPCRYDWGDPFPGVPLADLKPDGFIFHAPTSGRAAYPTRGGVLLPCLGPSLGKKYGFRWWLKGAERYGVPLPVMRIPEGDEQLEAKARELLRKMHADWSLVTWGDITLEKAAGTGEFTADVHQKLVDNSNTAIAIAILGQNLTTEVQGGSFAAATAHNYVRGDLLAGDAIEMAVTIRRHLLEPMCRLNGWTAEGPVPVYEFELGAKREAEFFEYHLRYGIPTYNQINERLGLPPRTDGTGDDYVKDPSLGVPADPLGGGAAVDPFVMAVAKELQARGQIPTMRNRATTTRPIPTSATSSTGAPKTRPEQSAPS